MNGLAKEGKIVLYVENIFMSVKNVKNSGSIYYDYEGIVIPFNLRGILNRNDTHGIYGILCS